jgi:glutamine synthetase
LERIVNRPDLTDVTWIDLLGRPRAMRVPTSRVEEPITVPRAGVLAGYGGWATVPGDLLAVADLETVRVPPWPGAPAIVMADLREPDGAESPLCSRTTLKRILADAGSDGFTIAAASELEFFLLDPQTGGPIYAEIENYSITKGSEAESVMRRVRNELRSMNVPVEATNPEYSGGQMEVNLTYGPALESADAATLLRSLVRTIARQEGFDATFMAKPWTDQAGSGMHVHQSLWKDEQGVFSDSGRLSELGRSYLAGLLAHLAELALFGCPTPNAYHRRTDLSFAPTVICWGGDNRTVAVRSIEGTETTTRVEQRDASADCNIYLTFAGQFAAGLRGMRERLEPPPPVIGNAYDRTDLEPVPKTFLEAFDLMNAGRAKELLGEETVRAYLDVLNEERNVLLLSSTDWERRRYMSSM